MTTLNQLDILTLDRASKNLSNEYYEHFSVSSSVHNKVAIFSLQSHEGEPAPEKLDLAKMETNIQMTLSDPEISKQFPELTRSFDEYAVYIDDKKVI